jgi:hypothetical protein
MHYYSVFKDRGPQGQTETLSLGPTCVNRSSIQRRAIFHILPLGTEKFLHCASIYNRFRENFAQQ